MASKSSSETARSIGRAIREARKRLGLTQLEAAKKCRMHPTTWARYEQGKREAPVTVIRQIEEGLGLRVTLAIQGNEDPVRPDESAPGDMQRGLMIAAQHVQTLAQDLMSMALATTPMRVPASVQGVRDALAVRRTPPARAS